MKLKASNWYFRCFWGFRYFSHIYEVDVFFPVFMATFPLFAKFHQVLLDLLAYGELETDWNKVEGAAAD